jgi:hypothetical protein
MDLVILAAGMGSRYGGLKQIDPVGPSGETVLDYAVFDARRAGFQRAVFVIRRDFEAMFRERVGAKYAGQMEVEYVFQSLQDLPLQAADGLSREKPWGTGHAVWCARQAVNSNFAVINADDFYGADSFRRLAGFLRAAPHPARADPARTIAAQVDTAPAGGIQAGGARPPGALAPTAGMARYAMVGFRLAQTLSEFGAVSRGVTTVDSAQRLVTIEERTGIQSGDVGSGGAYSGAEIVSMNCWGFTPEIFPQLEADLRQFVIDRGAEPKAEFYLPAAVAGLISRGAAEVTVLPTEANWFGVTYREDKPRVMTAIAALVAAQQYPARLF